MAYVEDITVGNITYPLQPCSVIKPIASPSDDTVENWVALGNVFAYYNTADCLTNQPSTYGFLLSMSANGNVTQLWFTQQTGKIYRRSGNSTGWGLSGHWNEIFQAEVCTTAAVETVVPVAKGGTGADTAANARTNLEVDKKVTYSTFSGTSLTGVDKYEYSNSTAIASLTITLPTAERGVIFGVNFTSGSSFSGVTFSSTVKQVGDTLSLTSKRYNLIIWYDGSSWWCAGKAA